MSIEIIFEGTLSYILDKKYINTFDNRLNCVLNFISKLNANVILCADYIVYF